MPGPISLRAAIDAKRRLDELGTARWIEDAANAVHKAQSGGQPIGKLAPEALLIKDGAVVVEPLATPVTAYCAPERLRGGAGDRRSDVFTLGAILWEALAHQRLFEGDEAAVRAAIERGDIPHVSEFNANVPAELDAICKKALAKDPSDRYQSAKVMAAEISAVLDDAGYPEGLEGITTWAAKELGAAPSAPAPAPSSAPVPAAPPAKPMNQTVMGLSPLKIPPKPGVVNDQTMPLAAVDIEVVPLMDKKADVVPLVTKKDTMPPPAAKPAPAPAPAPAPSSPSSLPSWASRPGQSTPPPANTTLTGPAIPKSVPSILTAPPAPAPEPARGASIADALARAKSPSSAPAPTVEPATSNVPTLVNASTLTPPTTAPGVMAPVQSSPTLKLPDAPPGATVSADKPSVFNGSTTAIVGSSISTAVPVAAAKPAFSGSQTAVLGSNAIIEAVNEAVSKAHPPVAAAAPAPALAPTPAPTPAPVLTPLPPVLPGGGGVKISEAETVGTPALAIPRTQTPDKPDIRAVVWDTPKHADSAKLSNPNVPAPAVEAAAAKLPPPADDDFADVPSSGTAKPNLRAASQSGAPDKPASSTQSQGIRRTRAETGGRATGGKDVLQGWGWGTDSHTALAEAADSDDYEAQDRARAKKRNIIIFGGLGGAVLLVLVLAFAFSGGKKTDDTVAQKPNEPPPGGQPAADPPKVDPPKTDPTPAVDPPKTDGSGSAETPKTDEPPKTDPAKIDPPGGQAPSGPPKVDPPKVDPPKVDPPKVDPPKKDPPKVDPPKKDPPKPPLVVKKDPPKKDPPKVDPTKPKIDAPTAYKNGIQLYMKGDTTNALTTFRQALVADPNYAPTWRGIGLVYEKLGRKAQAIQSFKRYLDLSPGAPDADQIKSRLERLGS